MIILPLSLLGLGFLLGVKHAFDADHIAAVSNILIKQHSIKKSSLLGMFWGFGHTMSLFVVGLIVLLLKITIPEKVALSMELVVGLMLVLLGVNTLITINKDGIHIHKHKHGKKEHVHIHSHKTSEYHNHKHIPFYKSLIVGIIHGLAGSAALTLLVLTTINSIFIGLFYILIFGIGSMIGMSVISAIILLPLKLIPNNFQKIHRILSASAGLISILVGLNIVF
ncbi:urease accessory protein UreH [Candidatus Woesearchaeota archaeon]|nr:urease accessory protein UreH [Candidatus Woesearchaeota archaeon]